MNSALLILCLKQVLYEPLVTVITGEIPIVISAPHGGKLAIPDCPLRTRKETPLFVTVEDSGTARLAQAIADEILKQTGKRPWVVVARFARKYADANRPAKWAFESEAAKKPYDDYHRALRKAVDSARKQDPFGLLIDVHGQKLDQNVVFRGTQNRKTVMGLLERRGEAGFTGKESFLGRLESSGIRISPTHSQTDQQEDSKYDGGFTVQTYGSSRKDGLDAIQLEFGEHYRNNQGYSETAKKIAQAIVDTYLANAKRQPTNL
jgi:N-formylglutamate amidohydrolase